MEVQYSRSDKDRNSEGEGEGGEREREERKGRGKGEERGRQGGCQRMIKGEGKERGDGLLFSYWSKRSNRKKNKILFLFFFSSLQSRAQIGITKANFNQSENLS